MCVTLFKLFSCFWLCLQLLVGPTLAGNYNFYRIVRNSLAPKPLDSSDKNVVFNNTFYILYWKFAKEIQHIDTILYFKFNATSEMEEMSYVNITNFYSVLPEKVPLIKRMDATPDEAMRTAMVEIAVFQEPLLQNLTDIGAFINPSVVPWQNRLFLCTGLCWTIGRLKYVPENIKGSIQCSWLNHTMKPINSSDLYMGLNIDIETSPLSQRLDGQDPRFLVLDDSNIVISYTYSTPDSRVRMGFAEIHAENNIISLSHVHPFIHADAGGNQNHKNWTPFLFNKSVCYIQSINPLHVVTIGQPSIFGKYNAINDREVQATTISIVPEVSLPWSFGHLRGGSNALLLDDKYVSFFHTCHFIPGNALKTYFMGAFTFTSTAPFRMLAISPVPLVDPSLYAVAWNPLKNRMIDYVVFPMSIFFEEGSDENNSTADRHIVLTFGHQDHTAQTARINVKKLLDSLIPVTD